MPPSYQPQPSNARRVFKVEQPDDKELGMYMTNDIERVYLSGTDDNKYIIIDTGSAQNLIGCHLLPTLKKRLELNGHELKLIKTEKTVR